MEGEGKVGETKCKVERAAAAASGVDTADRTEPESKPAAEIKPTESHDDENEPSNARPTEHIVKERETVNSIAALYDLTPSEMAQANKLGMSRLVFPGQVLRIPAPPPPPLMPASSPPVQLFPLPFRNMLDLLPLPWQHNSGGVDLL